jgi:parvulin-like peptidyl-prolyl cis-trans isomerase-like protein
VKHPGRLIVPVLVVALTAGACGTATPPAARVGGVRITEAQVTAEAAGLGFLSDLSQAPCGGGAVAGESADAECNRLALSRLIQSELLSAQPVVAARAADVQAAIGNLDAQLGADQVNTNLKAHGLDRTDLEKLVRGFLEEGPQRRAIAESELGTDGLQALYDQHISEFTTIEAEHILVATEAEADDAYRQVTAPGADEQTFKAVAKRVSTDSSKADGGLLPPTPASQLAPTFAEAAVGLEAGEISRPVQTQFGWHVIRLVSKDVKPLADVKNQLIDTDAVPIVNTWLRAEARRRGVEVNPRFGRFDLEALRVVRATSTDPSATESASPAP